MKTIIILTITFTLNLCVYSQVSQQWVARYKPSTGGVSEARDITTDAAGNVYVTGVSNVPVTSLDIATVKYNSAGVEQWAARYTGIGGLNNDIGTSVAVDGSGNVYVAGSSYGGPSLGIDFIIIKYGPAGNLIWDYRFTGPDGLDDELFKMVIDASANVYVCGSSIATGSQKDFMVLKLNSAGMAQWSRRYVHTNNDDYAIDLAVDGSGNVYVTGYASVPGNGQDFVTVKYNSAGTQQWVFPFNVGGDEIGISLGLDASGNAYVGGYTDAYGTGNDCFIYSVSSSGAFRWMQRYTGPGNNDDKIYRIAVDAAGNVAGVGNSNQGANGNDLFVVKYNSAGVQQWLNTLNVGGNDIATSVALDASGNVYLTGRTNAYGNGEDYVSVSYNSSGSFRWLTSYNYTGTWNDFALKVTVDASNNVYVTGNSWDDYATIKYSTTVGITAISNNSPDYFELKQNYPNPFNPATNINFNIPKQSNVKLAVFDVTGKEVARLVDNSLNAGTYSYDFNAANLPSGTYFYRLNAGDFSETKKMILIK